MTREQYRLNLYFECMCGFIELGLVQRLINCDEIPNARLTPDKVSNISIYGSPFDVTICRSYKLLNMV